MAEQENQTVYNLTELTEITQYNVEDVYKDGSETEKAFGEPKTFIPVFHGLQERPASEEHPNPVQLYEGHVEIGGPTQTPWDVEEFDDEILAQSGRERDIHPDSIAVSPTTGTVKLAQPLVTLQLSATVTPTSSEFPVTWTSGNGNKATVSETGLVTPVAEGEDISITATSGAVSASALIKVEKVEVTEVTLNKSEVTLAPEATETLTATVAPSNAYIQTVEWSSSDETIATVASGVVTAVANGTATITATATDDNTKTATCTVTVVTPVTGVELDESSITLTVGGTQQLTATISPETASDTAVIWSSSDETVATVDDGLVTALAEGTATITVTSHADGTITDDCSVTVNQGE